MATRLDDKIFVNGGYLDSNISVTSIAELIEKESSNAFFLGQSVHMPEAFTSVNEIPYPVDFWSTPNGENIKWEIKNMPALESSDDLERFKVFCDDFKSEAGYYPMTNGSKILVDGEEFELHIDDDGVAKWGSTQAIFDDTISDAVKIAIDNITSGASEAFDTLKEIEDWIKANSGSTSGPGADGKDGITPQLKIENGAWFVSYNEGETWEELGKATGEKGESGENGVDGKSAYQIWLDAGNDGSESDFLASLKGEKGDKGALDEEQIASLKGEIKSYTDEEISKIEIPTLDGVATEEWVNNQGFIKEHQDISHLATSADVASAIQKVEQKIPSLDGYATETFVKNAIADAQLSGGTDIDLSGYATKDDIKNLASKDEIKTYSSGTGVSIVDNKINVLIETGDTENRNYIKVNEDNSLSVEEIGLDDAVTTEDIQVNGGAWASAIQDIYGDTIPVGTSFQDFLKAMSCKEYFVSAITVSSSFTVSCGELKPGLSGANSGDMVEVGTEVILGTINGNETKARQSLTLSGFEYGYKIGENGGHINSKTYTQSPIPVASGETGNKTLRVTFNNFVSSITGGSISVKTGQTLIEKTTMYVQEGQNSVHIYQTGDTYSSNTNLTGGTFYISTNLKNYYKSDKSTPNTYVPTFPLISKTATASTTYSITGARKYYIGDIKDYSADYWNTDKNSVVLNLEIQDWATGNTITVPYTFKIGTKQQTVVVPAVYTNVSGKDANSGSVDFGLIKTITLTNSKGSKSQYNVFVAPAYDGLNTDSLINITIKKS